MSAREMSPDEIAARFAQARRAAATWRRTTLAQRVRALRAFWRAIAARRLELRAVIHEDTGRPLVEADLLELGPAAMLASWMCSSAPRVLGEKAAWKPWFLANKRAYERRVPRGVIGLITPWNMPFLIPFSDAFAALLAGNAAVIKPSERAPLCALWLERAAADTRLFPDGLLAVVTGGPDGGAAVVDGCDMVVFTGSLKAGRAVAERAAPQLKPVILELGGKHPMILLADAPLERAAAAAVWGACAGAGQLCVGVERVFVEPEAYAPFVELVRTRLARLRVRSDGKDADLGPLAAPELFERVQSQLEDARAKGAKVSGGEPLDRAGRLMAPALVADARMDMRVMTEETFGPVIPVMKVARAEEAAALVNAGPFGLAASVWTQDLDAGERLASALEAGVVGVNEPATHFALGSLPFGGMKASGLGRRHGEEGLLAFTQAQSVLVHEWPGDAPDPWWFPYEESKTALLRRLMGL